MVYISGCCCIDFTTQSSGIFRQTYGNCIRAGLLGSKTFCYVKEPSTCSDLQDRIIGIPSSDHRYSKEACKETPPGVTPGTKYN